jgi:hypothetical protein
MAVGVRHQLRIGQVHLLKLEADNKHSKIEMKVESKQFLIERNSQLRKLKKRQNIKPKKRKNLKKTLLIHSGISKILEVCSEEIWG